MRVTYDDPDGREGTFHPHLGWLESGKEFVMYDDEEAKKYIKSGLLKKAKTQNSKLRTQNPELKNKEVKDNGKSTDR